VASEAEVYPNAWAKYRRMMANSRRADFIWEVYRNRALAEIEHGDRTSNAYGWASQFLYALHEIETLKMELHDLKQQGEWR
jgi:hypothetical protein